jgi:L-iditol 2-dehydrogenase
VIKPFFKPYKIHAKAVKFYFFAEFPDEVKIPLNPNILYRNEIDLMGSYSSSFKLQNIAVDIVFNKRIDVTSLISDRYPLKDLANAVEQAVSPTPDTYKILLYPDR